MPDLSVFLLWILSLSQGLAILFVIHAIITRQDLYWIIMLGISAFFGGFLSPIFVAIYAYMAFLPWLRNRSQQAGQAVQRTYETMRPLDIQISEAQELLADSDTLEHRTKLAALQARAKELDDAQATLAPLLKGIYADDPLVLLTSAEIDFANLAYAEAERKLSQPDLQSSAATKTRALTLLARVQEAADSPQTDQTYQQALHGANTEEPRVRYVSYLQDQGRFTEAAEILATINKTEQKASHLYRKQEREWFQMAQELRQKQQ